MNLNASAHCINASITVGFRFNEDAAQYAKLNCET